MKHQPYLRYNIIFDVAGCTAVMVGQPMNINLLEAAWFGLAQATQNFVAGKQSKFTEGWSCVIHIHIVQGLAVFSYNF